jgi:hypothetical protein
MKQVLAMDGLQSVLQERVKDHFDSIRGLLIGESGREATITFAKYGGIQAQFLIQCPGITSS